MTGHVVSARQLASRFPGNRARCYAWCKYATDPLYAAVYTALADTTVPLLDVGCGMGLCSFYLRARGWQAPITAIDVDANKIAVARHMSELAAADLHFAQRDVRDGLPEHSGSVTILDTLQYMNAAAQVALLREATARVTVQGKLVIRSGMDTPSWRFALTRAGDWAAKLGVWIESAPVHYPRPDTLTAVLESFGMRGTIRPLWGRTPFNNYLAVFAHPRS